MFRGKAGRIRYAAEERSPNVYAARVPSEQNERTKRSEGSSSLADRAWAAEVGWPPPRSEEKTSCLVKLG